MILAREATKMGNSEGAGEIHSLDGKIFSQNNLSLGTWKMLESILDCQKQDYDSSNLLKQVHQKKPLQVHP